MAMVLNSTRHLSSKRALFQTPKKNCNAKSWNYPKAFPAPCPPIWQYFLGAPLCQAVLTALGTTKKRETWFTPSRSSYRKNWQVHKCLPQTEWTPSAMCWSSAEVKERPFWYGERWDIRRASWRRWCWAEPWEVWAFPQVDRERPSR